MLKKLTIDEFIAKANNIHNSKYDYSLVEYTNAISKVPILCDKHGIFNQRANAHMGGQKCPLCAKDERLKKITSTAEEFVLKAREIHGDEYSYSLIRYINNKTKVKIYCKEHGVFEQTPNDHLQNHKCPKCFNKINDISYITDNLTIEEDPIKIDDVIKCRCTYCKEYFTPTTQQLHSRMASLSGKQCGEHRLYCSDKCKNLCPIFGKSKHYSGTKLDTSRPDQHQLRKIVLERDNNQCQRCGSSEDLHCHHITGVEINPIESADIDNCITLCYTCHNKAHNERGCNMKREPCTG